VALSKNESRRIERLAVWLLEEGLSEAGEVGHWMDVLYLVEEQPPAVLEFLDALADKLHIWCSVFEHEIRTYVPQHRTI
jgi:hypothetical protein